MQDSPIEPASERLWQKTQYANLVRYVPSGTYFARMRVNGKLIRKSLKTDVISVAKLRLSDLEKSERQSMGLLDISKGKLTFSDAEQIYRQRIHANLSLKQRTKAYCLERIKALYKSWPTLPKTEIRAIAKTDCLN